MTGGPTKPKRILVGAANFADAETALNLARLVARGAPSDLIGLMAGDISQALDEILPAGGLVTPSGRLVATPGREQMAKLIESEQRAFRRSLAALAGALSAGWAFETRPGTLEQALAAWHEDWDVLLLGHRKLHRRRGPVALVCGAVFKDDEAAQLALSLAAAMETNVLALEVDRPGKGIGEGALAAQTTRVSFANSAALLAYLDRANVSAVVLDWSSGPFSTIGMLREVQEAARCPLVVVTPEKSEQG